MSVRTIEWRGDAVKILDQRLLPQREVFKVCTNYREIAQAIRAMVIRGAPALGVATAMALAMGIRGTFGAQAKRRFDQVASVLKATRPTAVNIHWAIERMRRVLEANLHLDKRGLFQQMKDEALRIQQEDISANRALGRFGAELLGDESTILTHCNAGALATAGYGTAMGIVRAAREQGKKVTVIAGETRPYLQGARLTAWELHKDRIQVRVIADNMIGWVLARKMVDCVIVGADRVAANGDVANKIGTYPIAVLAHRHKVPFYVAAPLSSIDLSCRSGEQIPIEERPAEELTSINGTRLVPRGVKVFNPAFDVTPGNLITALVTERGVVRPPLSRNLARHVRMWSDTALVEKKQA